MLSLVRIRLGVVPAVLLSLRLLLVQIASLTFPREVSKSLLSAGYLGHLARGSFPI